MEEYGEQAESMTQVGLLGVPAWLEADHHLCCQRTNLPHGEAMALEAKHRCAPGAWRWGAWLCSPSSLKLVE